jgi:hypothetical protein
MFIKVFVPNANGKIELTVQELESLLKQAADKAVAEDREHRPLTVGGLLNQPYYKKPFDVDPAWDWTKVTCGDTNSALLTTNKKNISTTTIGINKEIKGE